MPRRSRQMILLALLLTTSVAAQAQSQPTRDARRMNVSFGVHGYYDSNILRGQDVQISQPDSRQSDYVAEPRATADIVLPFGRQSLFANGALGYRFHAHNSFLDRESIDTKAGLRLRPITPCTTILTGAYARQQSDLANIFDTADPTNVETLVSGAADLSCASAAGLSTTLGYRHLRATNSALVRQINEYRSNRYTTSIGIVRPRLGVVSIYGSYVTSRYPNRQLIGPGRLDGVDVYSAGLRYRRDLGTRLTGEISGGYSKVNPRLSGVRPFKGASWSADLSYDSRNRIRASVSAERSVEQSNLIGESYGTTQAYRLNLSYALSRRFQLTTGAAYVRRRFEQSPLVQLPKFNSHDRTVSVYARLTAGTVGPVAIAFDVAREHRKAAVTDFNYGSTRVGVTATYRFGR